ncbi:hypothetical protein [Sporolactobacillus terrae]|uniref:hypothetical protein n=1 Tax=Sporolactobacillus terrae TaxID=269673 RepID=UPI001CBD8492|nr:hypothetical protein [Sporolactobacillus terrae]UAK18090.1 hypothetical protein K7399_16000 [Sporolactobacillus terrae]
MKNRTLAGFNEVANSEPSKEIKENNQKMKETTSESHNNNAVDDLIENEKKKTILRGFVLDIDVVKAIDRISKGKGRGFKSEFVNTVLKQVLSDKGLL